MVATKFLLRWAIIQPVMVDVTAASYTTQKVSCDSKGNKLNNLSEVEDGDTCSMIICEW